jgi:uncharacterized protein
MTFRFLRWLHRRGVSRRKLRHGWLHRVLGERLFSKDLWAFRRDGVARGWFIGSLVGATPLLGVQLLLALPLALLWRANLLVVIALVFTTNPFTAGLFYPFAFLVGCRVLGRAAGDFHWDNRPVWHAGGPLFLGCAVIGLVVGVTGYVLLRLLWRERSSSARSAGPV